MSKDPNGEEGAQLIVFCHNDPIAKVDPTGLFSLGRCDCEEKPQDDLKGSKHGGQFHPGDVKIYVTAKEPVQCDDAPGEWKLNGFDYSCGKMWIGYNPDHNPDDKDPFRPPSTKRKTIRQHERAHAIAVEALIGRFIDEFLKYDKKCECVPCLNSITRYLGAYREYLYGLYDMEQEQIDMEDYYKDSEEQIEHKNKYIKAKQYIESKLKPEVNQAITTRQNICGY